LCAEFLAMSRRKRVPLNQHDRSVLRLLQLLEFFSGIDCFTCKKCDVQLIALNMKLSKSNLSFTA